MLSHRFDDAEKALAEAEGLADVPNALRLDLLRSRARLSFLDGRFEDAARRYGQLLEEHRSRGNTHAELMMASNLAETEHARGRTGQAVEIMLGILPTARAGAATGAVAVMLNNLAGYLAAAGDLSGAATAIGEAIVVNADAESHRAHAAVAIEVAALVFALRGDVARAAMLEGYADATLRRYGFEREFTERTTNERLALVLRQGLSSEELARLTEEGASLPSHDAVALALDELI